MSNIFTEVTRRNYFGRIGDSISGVLVGAVVFLISIGVLWWNEGRAVHRAKALTEGAAAVVSIDPQKLDPANEGKLVHFTGEPSAEKLTDPLFGITQEAIHLQRVVEICQWKESEKTVTEKDTIGGGSKTTKTYSYDKTWSEKLLSSHDFKHPEGHINPTTPRISAKIWTASAPAVGAITLSPELLEKVNNYSPTPITAEDIAKMPTTMRSDATLVGETCYVSGKPGKVPDPDSSEVGDMKISLRTAPPAVLSVIARQTGSTLSDYQTASGERLQGMLYMGPHSAADMFKTEQDNNEKLTWILRFGGFIAMFIAINLVMRPLKMMADLVGFIGSIVGAGIALVAFFVAAAISLLTIAVAWLAYRPLLGGGLLILAAAAVFMLVKMLRKKSNIPPVPARV